MVLIQPAGGGGSEALMVWIRRLRERDRADWKRLRCALWPREAADKIEDEMADLLAHAKSMPVFVAERPQGGLCGLVEVSLRAAAAGCTTTPVGYLEAWFVDPEWRGQGIGRQLVAMAEAWAREQGCTEMASDTNQEYPASPAAHARLGYEEVRRDTYFRKNLVTGTPPETAPTTRAL